MIDSTNRRTLGELLVTAAGAEKLNFEHEVVLRPEQPADYHAVELLTREAFWGDLRPTCDEHYLVHLLRESPAFVPELDVVAEAEGRLVGNVMYSKATVTDDAGTRHEVLTFGPLSVLPEYWHCGVGSALMKHTILKARDLGYPAILLHGHPDYYPRFGFQNAAVFGITNAAGENYDALMAMELYPGALSGVSGRFEEDSVFDIRAEDATLYNEKNFPPKEPAAMVPIEVLLEKLPETAQNAFRQQKITALQDLNRLSGREMLGWEGIDREVLQQINRVLREEGFSQKLLPGCKILEQAKRGIAALL